MYALVDLCYGDASKVIGDLGFPFNHAARLDFNLTNGTGLLRLRSGLSVDASEEKLAFLVLKQERLFFSSFNFLDQEATPF
jgi:hypothetical protein